MIGLKTGNKKKEHFILNKNLRSKATSRSLTSSRKSNMMGLPRRTKWIHTMLSPPLVFGIPPQPSTSATISSTKKTQMTHLPKFWIEFKNSRFNLQIGSQKLLQHEITYPLKQNNWWLPGLSLPRSLTILFHLLSSLVLRISKKSWLFQLLRKTMNLFPRRGPWFLIMFIKRLNQVKSGPIISMLT